LSLKAAGSVSIPDRGGLIPDHGRWQVVLTCQRQFSHEHQEHIMPTLFDALRSYLLPRCPNNLDFVEKVLAAGAELQIVPQPLGRLIDDTNVREYDGHRLFDLRYPRNSATTPEWREPSCPYPLEYVDRIGSTGHTESGSLFVALDVDTVAGHAPGVGVPDAERERILKAVEHLDYVEVRRSTGGAGFHLFMWLKGFVTANHAEHAAVARALLGKACHDARLDFAPLVDACGTNFWFWRYDPHPDSFRLLKPATTIVTPDDLPNWRDHIDVVTRKRSRVAVDGLDVEEAASYPAVGRDADHEKILAAYDRRFVLEYVPDYQCYRAHTAALAKVHTDLALKGAFATTSTGNDPGTPNCFVFLRQNGSLLVVRYGTTSEHPMWDKTAKGQSCITFNAPITPEAAARAVSAVQIGPPWEIHLR
jgi:hypothetical protein